MFILPSFHAGGTENYAWRFIKYYNEKHELNVRWYVWSVLNEKGDLEINFLDEGCNTKTISLGYANPKSMLKFYHWIRKNNIKTVVNFNGNFGGMSMWVALLAGVPVRIVWYRRSTNAFKSSLIKNLYNNISKFLVYKYSTQILSNSFAAFDYFFRIYKYEKDNRFRVIPNGVNLNEFIFSGSKFDARSILGIPMDKYVIGHVGRFDPAKNHETLFKVIQKLTTVNNDFIFLFCGKDTDGQQFNSKLKEYGISDYVISLGLSNQLNVVYKSMDLFVFPSITEGQPNALLEAIISGLPFFASDIIPIKELVPEFSFKYLFPPNEVDKILSLIIAELNGSIDRHDQIKIKNTMIDSYNQEKHYNSFAKIING